MAKKKLIKIEAEDLFDKTITKTANDCKVYFKFLENQCLRLCWEYDSGIDGCIQFKCSNEINIPEFITINGENYRVTEIGICAFSFYSWIKSIYIPESVNTIECDAFWRFSNRGICSELSEIRVSEKNETYDSRENCNAIIETKTNTLIVGCTNSVIPSSVERIRSGAFCDSDFKTIRIASNIIDIGFGFADCPHVTTIEVSEDNKYYDSRGDCNAIIETATNTLIRGCKNTIIPNTVKIIAFHAFDAVVGLKSITIPNGVRIIDSWAFSNCWSLETVEISKSVHTIRKLAFVSNYIKSVTIKNKKAKIDKHAFDSQVIINGQPRDYWSSVKGDYLDLQKN